ncbi:MAG: hypothetical protein IPN01_19825 [Deltaproteobacteria bacterium]|nr:hypothetical protein [Deltaproteobacteria bacterium]
MPENGISEFELSAWLLGALDPDRAEELAQAVARSPALAERARARQRVLERLPTLRARPMPIPGSDWRGQLVARRVHAGNLGEDALGEGLRPGDRVELRVSALTDPTRRELVAMTRDAEGRWDVVWPEHADERTPVEALERDADGALKVSLSASPTIGTQRWLLVFPETPWPVDWSLPRAIRWEQLMARISTGAVPLFTFELEVSAP